MPLHTRQTKFLFKYTIYTRCWLYFCLWLYFFTFFSPSLQIIGLCDKDKGTVIVVVVVIEALCKIIRKHIVRVVELVHLHDISMKTVLEGTNQTSRKKSVEEPEPCIVSCNMKNDLTPSAIDEAMCFKNLYLYGIMVCAVHPMLLSPLLLVHFHFWYNAVVVDGVNCVSLLQSLFML